jgi:hypothetical protein
LSVTVLVFVVTVAPVGVKLACSVTFSRLSVLISFLSRILPAAVNLTLTGTVWVDRSTALTDAISTRFPFTVEVHATASFPAPAIATDAVYPPDLRIAASVALLPVTVRASVSVTANALAVSPCPAAVVGAGGAGVPVVGVGEAGVDVVGVGGAGVDVVGVGDTPDPPVAPGPLEPPPAGALAVT